MFIKRYPQPANDEDFERLCTALFRAAWKAPNTQRFGSSGQRQFGVDIVGSSEGNTFGAQCKSRETVLTAADLSAAIEEAKSFKPPLKHFVVATTGKRTTELQLIALEATNKHHPEGLFSVEVAFWDELNDLLNRYREIAEEFYPAVDLSLPPTPVDGPIPVGAIDASGSAGGFHAEIDKAKAAVQEAKPEVALAKLNEIRERHWDKLTSRERYRVEVNTGNAYTLLGDLKKAADHFSVAATLQPDDSEARALGALAHKYRGAKDKAHADAAAARTLSGNRALAFAVWVETAPDLEPLQELVNAIPEDLRATSVVSFSIARAAQARSLFADAEAYARAAIARDPNWDEPKLELAITLLMRESSIWSGVAAEAISAKNPRAVREAIEILKSLLNKAETRASAVSLGIVRRNLAHAYLLLGEKRAAATEIEKAFDADPSDPQLIVRHAANLIEWNRLDDAIAMLEHHLGRQEAVSLRACLASALRARHAPGDVERAVHVAREGLARAIGHDDLAGDLLAELVFAHESLGSLRASLADIDQAKPEVVPLPEKLALRALVLHRLGDDESARTAAIEAAASVSASTAWYSTRRVALVLMDLEMYDRAFAAWLSILPPKVVGHDTEYLLQSALRSNNDWAAIKYCQELRANGGATQRTLDFEVELLRKYRSYSLAIEATRSFYARAESDVDRRRGNLRVLALQLQSGVPESSADPESLPTAAEVTPFEGYLVAAVLAWARRHDAAMAFAYALVRRFPNRVEPRIAMITASGIGMEREAELPPTPVVGPGVAFAVQESPGGETRWHVIEVDNPQPVLDEVAPTHPIAAAAIGKQKGDAIEWRNPGGLVHKAQIVDLAHAYVFRLRWCMERQRTDFPGEMILESMELPRDSDGEIDPQELRRMMKAQLEGGYQRGNELLARFKRDPMPVSLLARGLGRDEIDTQLALTAEAEPCIRCGAIGGSTATDGLRALDEGRSLVLCPTGAATLMLLDRADDLGRIRIPVFVTEGFLTSLRATRALEARRGMSSGTLVLMNGEPSLIEDSPEAVRARRQRFDKLMSAIEKHAKVLPGVARARLSHEIRESHDRVLGEENTEAIAVASEIRGLLWVDDAIVGIAAAAPVGVPRVWTSLLYDYLAAKKAIDQGVADETTAKLHAAGYLGLTLNGRVLAKAIELAEWNVSAPTAAKALDILRRPSTSFDVLATVAIDTCVFAWRRCPRDEVGRSVVEAVLQRVAKIPGGEAVVQRMKAMLGVKFGLDVISAMKTKQTIDRWEAGESGGLLFVPRT